MSNFVLHVGQMKSGTTYIQNILSNNRDELLEKGWVYPGSRLNHQHACYGICGRNIPWVQDSTIFKKFSDNLLDTINKTDKNVIVSAECLSSLDEDGIRSFINTVGKPDKVVVTVRGLLKTLPSAWQQSVKGGSRKSIDRFYSDLVEHRANNSGLWRTYRYGRTVELWSKFAPVQVVIIPEKSDDKSLLWNLFQTCSGLPSLANIDVMKAKSNSSINYETAELLRSFNAILSERGYGKRANERFNDIYLRDFYFSHDGIKGTKISHLEKYEPHVVTWNLEEYELLSRFAERIEGDVENLYKSSSSMIADDLVINPLTEQIMQQVFNFVARKSNLDNWV